MILPPILGTTGVWLAIPIAETLAVVASVMLLYKHRTVYHYGEGEFKSTENIATKEIS